MEHALVPMAKDFQIETQADLTKAVSILHQLKSLRQTISSASKCEDVTEAVYAAHKLACAAAKAHVGPIDDADEFLRKRIKNFIQSTGVDGGVPGIIIKMVPRYTVQDSALVPEEYWAHQIDMTKIDERVKKLRKQANIPGVVVWEEPQIVMSQEAPE